MSKSSKNNPPQLDDAPDFEESNRPSKRRRQDDHSKVLDWADGTNKPFMGRASSPSSQNSAKPRSSELAKLHNEFRGVEDSIKINRSPQLLRRSQHTRFPSDGSPEERSTSIAAEQRRSGAPNADKGKQANKRPELPKQSLLDIFENPDSTAKNLSYQNGVSGKSHAVPNTRESPDELQGEATTRAVPNFLDDTKNQPRRKLDADKPLSPVRKRSPSDIRTTEFASSSPQGSKKVKRSHGLSPPRVNINVNYLRHGSIVRIGKQNQHYSVRLTPQKIELGEEFTGQRKKMDILLRNVRSAYRGIETSRKIRLKLSQKSESPGDSFVDIELTSQNDKLLLLEQLEASQIKVQDKTEYVIQIDILHFKSADFHIRLFLEKAFLNYAAEMTEHAKHSKQPFQDASSSEPASTTPARPKTRQKISSALQNTKDETNESNRVKTKTSTRDGTGQMDGSGDLREAPSDRKDDSDSGVQIPVKPFMPKESAERETRATRRTTRVTWESTGPNASTDNKVPQTHLEDDVSRKKWKKPLVYPWTGKKKAEVCIEDRDRLREDEFLNDNLIGFYMRFLQDHLERTNRKAAEKVYFFNSYFFDTLTNTPKGERGINYSGVEKWTRSVDLFSYDYIVVPINQAAHWYVAIICNLPSLEVGKADSVQQSSASVSEKETSNQPESDVHEILESPEPEPAPVFPSREKKTRNSESPSSQDARQSFASMTIQEEEKAQREAEKSEAPTETEEWPEGQENQTLPPAKSSPFKETPNEPQITSHTASQAARKTRKGKAGPKLSPKQTTIVTFDSLDLGRSPTIKMLRDYICKEASSKRGVQIDPTDIKGMRARQIPLQPNFSDCGLYLLAYVEKFVQDPDSFVTKLLQREMDQVDDWPPLGSGLLRHRLRKFLDDLYDEQAHIKNLPSGRAIMADQQPVSYLLGPPLPSQADPDEKGSAESPWPTDAMKDKVVQETPVLENTVSENDEQSGSLVADQPDLVLAASPAIPDLLKGKKAPGPLSADADATPRPGPSKDEETVEVPDSQEIMQAPESPKLNCAEKKKPAKSEEVPTDRKPERKKATIPSDTAVVDVEQPSPKKPAKAPQMEVQIQVRRTPPPSSPKNVRKSPRGKPRKD